MMKAIVVLFLFIAGSLWAKPALFGPEFTFTEAEIFYQANYQLDPITKEKNILPLRQKIVEYIGNVSKACQQIPGCREIFNSHKTAFDDREDGESLAKFQLADGFIIDIAEDPSVVEIRTTANTYAQFLDKKNVLQKIIFDSAAETGLSALLTQATDALSGSNHLNIGLDVFEGNYLFFRNFFIDLVNHQNLFVGIFEDDEFNAPPIGLLYQDQVEAFKNLMTSFDQAFSNKDQLSIEQFAREVQKRVYTHGLGSNPHQREVPEKYQLLNVTSIPDASVEAQRKRIEIRGMRAHRSMDEFLAVVEIFQNRLDYISKKNELITLSIPAKKAPSLTKQLELYYEFTQAVGVSWEKARLILMDDYLKLESKVCSQNLK